jgi:hypothetical protein
MQVGTEASRYIGVFGWKTTSSGRMMLLSEGRPDGMTGRPDGWEQRTDERPVEMTRLSGRLAGNQNL